VRISVLFQVWMINFCCEKNNFRVRCGTKGDKSQSAECEKCGYVKSKGEWIQKALVYIQTRERYVMHDLEENKIKVVSLREEFFFFCFVEILMVEVCSTNVFSFNLFLLLRWSLAYFLIVLILFLLVWNVLLCYFVSHDCFNVLLILENCCWHIW